MVWVNVDIYMAFKQIAKLQIQPESGGHYIRLVVCLVVWLFVETLRLSRQKQTRLSPGQTMLDKARPDQTRPDQSFLTPW